DLADDLSDRGHAIDDFAIDERLEFAGDENPDTLARFSLADEFLPGVDCVPLTGPNQGCQRHVGYTGKVGVFPEKRGQFGFSHASDSLLPQKWGRRQAGVWAKSRSRSEWKCRILPPQI